MAQNWIRYCRHCVLPETRPNTDIDTHGVCKACRNIEHDQFISALRVIHTGGSEWVPGIAISVPSPF